jgi:hypothetical protein
MAKDGRKRTRRRDQAERFRMRSDRRAAAADERPAPEREAPATHETRTHRTGVSESRVKEGTQGETRRRTIDASRLAWETSRA